MSVPLQSELTNPFSANKRAKSKLITKSSNNLPDNLKDWNSKDFVDYFALQYKANLNGYYKKTYSSDCISINEIMDFMDANELDINEWTKKFIDWSFANKDHITKNYGSFLLSTIKKSLNSYFQIEISNSRKSKNKLDILDEVKNAVDNGKTKEILASYGIPVIATYFTNFRNIPDDNIKLGLNKLFESLLSGAIEEQALVKKIVQRSISRSPYPVGFSLLDWRDIFPELKMKYKNENWWRNEDYSEQSLFQYDRLLKGEG